MRQHVPARAVDLGCAAQRVRVLDGVGRVPVAGEQRRAGQQPAQVRGRGQLAGVRADRDHPLVVRAVGAEQRLDRQRAGEVGGLGEQLGVGEREGEQRLHRLGAVDEGQSLLRRQGQRGEPGLGEQLGGRAPARVVSGGGAAGPPRPAAARPRRAGRGRRTPRPSPWPGRPAAGRGRAARAGGPAARVGSRTRRRPSVRARSSSSARTASSGSGGPTPAAWLRMSASCIRARSSWAMETSASAPKPVVTP